MKIHLLFPFLLMSLLTPSCSSPTENESSVQDITRQNNAYNRANFIKINFTKWPDFVAVSGVFNAPTAESNQCTFAVPKTDHETVRWAPMQAFWVHVKKHSKMVDGFKDVFFPGDSVSKDNFAGALGLRQLSSLNRKFFSISDVKLSEDKTTLAAKFTIPMGSEPYESLVNISGVIEGDKCLPVVTDLSTNTTITDINVKQNLLGFAKSVVTQ